MIPVNAGERVKQAACPVGPVFFPQRGAVRFDHAVERCGLTINRLFGGVVMPGSVLAVLSGAMGAGRETLVTPAICPSEPALACTMQVKKAILLQRPVVLLRYDLCDLMGVASQAVADRWLFRLGILLSLLVDFFPRGIAGTLMQKGARP